MLIGEYQTKLTEKNRIAVPSAFRDILGKEIVITKGYEGCLIIVSKSEFQAFIEPLENGPFLSKAVRDSTRFLVGSAYHITLDDQGRFVLPKALIDYSGVAKDIVFTGLSKWVEIWDQNKWQDKISEIETSASEIAETLSSTNTNGTN